MYFVVPAAEQRGGAATEAEVRRHETDHRDHEAREAGYRQGFGGEPVSSV
jgi:hypothetical protein